MSMAITKIIGALFKIPLANLLGGTGMGFFSSAYGLYSPVFALTAAAIPTVIMRITARSAAVGNKEHALAVRKYALILFTIVGLIGTAAVAVFSRPFAERIACSPQSRVAIICIAPAIVICCIASVLRGYREGLSDVMPSAAASIAEAASRAVFGLGLSYAVVYYAKSRFLNGESVFGADVSTVEQAYEQSLPYAAAGAILAVSISELCGLITLLISEKKYRGTEKLPPRCSYCRTKICIQLIKETIPIAASALVVNAISFVDLLTVTRTLAASAALHPEYYDNVFSGIYDKCGGLDGLPNFMYGSYTGLAMSIFMLIPSFAGMAEKTAAPDIAAAWEKGDYETLKGKIVTQLRTCALIACPACFGAAALADPIMTMLYRTRAAEVSVCLNSFIILCLGGLFMVLASSLFGIFQSIGKAHIPLILMSISVVIKLILNPILISIPILNISGSAVSNIAAYCFMTVTGFAILNKSLPKKIRVSTIVSSPILCGMSCGFAAYVVCSMVSKRISLPLTVIFSTISGGIVYVILLILTGGFRTIGIIKRKNEKKIKKPLEKSKKIG